MRLVKHTIDCKSDPHLCRGEEDIDVAEHRYFDGFEYFDWNPDKITFFYSETQKKRNTHIGTSLRKELDSQLPLNANVCDFLIKNPDLIPKEWRKVYSVLFWGTIYRDLSHPRDRWVKSLRWTGRKWVLGYELLTRGVNGNQPAAVFVS